MNKIKEFTLTAQVRFNIPDSMSTLIFREFTLTAQVRFNNNIVPPSYILMEFTLTAQVRFNGKNRKLTEKNNINKIQ